MLSAQPEQTWQYPRWQSILLLMPLIFSFAVALDLYIPVVPAIAKEFQATSGDMQSTLSLFMLSFGIGQLILAPLSDRYGRRRSLLLSAVGYGLSSLLCAGAHSLSQLILYRMVQGVAACGMLINTNALVRDVYTAEEVPAMYGYLNMAISFSPMIAPLLGGMIAVRWGWQACFWLLAGLGLFATLLITGLIPETHRLENRLPIDRQLLKHYRDVVCHRGFLFHAFSASAGIACLFSFFSISPYLLEVQLGVPTDQFGYYFGVMGLLFFFGSLATGRLLEWVAVGRLIRMGAGLIVIGGGLMFVWFQWVGLTRFGFIVPMIPMACGAAFVSGAGIGGAMAPFPEKAGIAAALFGCAEFVFSSAIGGVVMFTEPTTTIPLASVAMLMGGAILLWGQYYQRGHKT